MPSAAVVALGQEALMVAAREPADLRRTMWLSSALAKGDSRLYRDSDGVAIHGCELLPILHLLQHNLGGQDGCAEDIIDLSRSAQDTEIATEVPQ